jgi:CRISPR/Cas system-associated protein Cas5 (RAMP superfamily)
LSSKVDSDVYSALCLSTLEIPKKASKVEFWKILSFGGRGNYCSINLATKVDSDVFSVLSVSALEIFKKLLE